MLTLFQFPALFGMSNPSPFCLKVEVFLKHHGIPYQTKMLGDTRKAPKGKLPFITDDGKTIADSTFIIQFLEETRGIDTDSHLNERDRACAHAFRVMLEERFYWAMVYTRWVGPNWESNRVELARVMPPVIRNVVPALIHRQIRSDLRSHGLGRHNEADIYHLAEKDIRSVAALLGRRQFLLGDQLSSLDMAAYAFLGNAWLDNQPGPLKDALGQFDALTAYLEKLHALWFH